MFLLSIQLTILYTAKSLSSFSLFFGTFDAIVLMASIYILFPKEHRDLVRSAIQHFQWAVERFEAMSERNALARSALGVLQAIHVRLRRSLNKTAQKPGKAPPPAITGVSSATNHYHSPRTADNPSPQNSDGPTTTGSAFTPTGSDVFSSSSSTETTSSSASASSSSTAPSLEHSYHHYHSQYQPNPHPSGFDFPLPSDFDWSTIQPIFATGDLVYNDLDVPSAWADVDATAGGGSGGLGGGDPGGALQPWQFDGDFGSDSVWSLLNHYNPL